jgi:exosortase
MDGRRGLSLRVPDIHGSAAGRGLCWRRFQTRLAEAAAMYFSIAGTTLVRHGTVFELPGIVLEVAQECSGIRSSWVLVITSLLASHLFLRSPWRRIVLVAFVIPLGLLRNGFRVFVIGMRCVRVGPHMVSIIHRRGGPSSLRCR